MDSISIDGTPFSVLMSQAVKLKTAQDAPSRSIYDSYPSFYKNSIFPHDEVIDSRNKPFVKRMKDAVKWKEEGNISMEKGNFIDAITKYEIALSVFKYLENWNGNWKTEGIRDEDIKENKFYSEHNWEMEKVQSFLYTCYTNIALASIKAENFSLALDACNQVLQYNRFHVKALYLRSKALVVPKSAGATENDMALRDLRTALKVEPHNEALRKEFHKLSSRRKCQKLHDRATFGGMFARGRIYEDKESQFKKEVNTSNAQKFDFDNPSPNMINDAARLGIDLKDAEVVKILKKIQTERANPTGKGEDLSQKSNVGNECRGYGETSGNLKLKIVCFMVWVMVHYYLRQKGEKM